MLVWSKWNINRSVSVYCYNGAQCYGQFLDVGQLERALISSFEHLCIFGLYVAVCIKHFLLHSLVIF